jgi:hypothetical protein
MDMTNISDQSDSGYFVLLETLNRHLAEISDDVHQWAATPVPGIFPDREGSRHSFVLIAYSNPDSTWLLNPIVVIAPLFSLGGENTGYPAFIVSLSSKSISPLKGGLYYEDDEVKYDSLEDFSRIWNPIKDKLWPEHCDQKPSAVSSVTRGREGNTTQQHSVYRMEFLDYLENLARSPDVQAEVGQVPDFEYVMERISALFRDLRKDDRESDDQ